MPNRDHLRGFWVQLGDNPFGREPAPVERKENDRLVDRQQTSHRLWKLPHLIRQRRRLYLCAGATSGRARRWLSTGTLCQGAQPIKRFIDSRVVVIRLLEGYSAICILVAHTSKAER
jgi:hypothetical protein